MPNSLGEQVLKRWNDRRIGEPVMEAHGQAFRLHQHAREATCPISEKPLGLPGDGKKLDGPGMAEAEASPRDIETVAARVRGARDANEAFDVAETPAGDDPDARLRVTGKTAQEAARSLGKTRGLGTRDDGREGAVEVGEKDQRAPARQALLHGATKGHEPVTPP